jgi:type IV secretory pathway VirB10-like protein
VTTLKEAIIYNHLALKFSLITLATATVSLLALLSEPFEEPSHVSAQITPTLSRESSEIGVGLMTQEPVSPVQNSSSANITQLATILPVANQPITPASFTPVSEVAEESDTTSTQNDDDDSDDSNSDNDNDTDNGDGSDDSNNDNGDDSDDSNNDSGDDEDSDDEEDDDGDDDGDGGGFAFAGAGGAFAFAG